MMDQSTTQAMLKQLRLMDDVFMNVAFNGATDCVDQILDAVFGKDVIKTVTVQTQAHMEELEGKSVYMDILARDQQGRYYNIEVQQEDKGATLERACYHISVLGVKARAKGTNYAKPVPDRYVIFLTEHDVVGQKCPLYHFEWSLQESPAAVLSNDFQPKEHIIYINGAWKEDHTLLGDLVHDFKCMDPDLMRNSILRDRVKYFKEKEGVTEMSSLMEQWREEFLAEGRAEGRAETTMEFVKKMLKNGFSAMDIAKGAEIPLDKVEEIQAQMAN